MKSILIFLLLVSVPIHAKTFTVTSPTQNEDGTPFDAVTQQKESRIYCDGPLLVVIPGITNTIDYPLPPGSYSCTATVVTLKGTESEVSDPVNFIVESPPGKPVLEAT